ncbi:SMP-30/gluconolactonase/LRE family protein [Fibrella aquatilis]|uniref:SMP-30/gluconolactonase/LRE family protein n=1 Tax=Fibrella aquatilis TaxID=2817059 RepID=A0A939G0C1_9BACT|nr:SMP-30/gluconolactonase/LRE family protein [Fibrella aquatilis]MBO0929614.1 SMP-30/gluconolactonase/LRE family protein [Fibrella aquatilis]
MTAPFVSVTTLLLGICLSCSAATAKPKPKRLTKLWESDTTLRVPESVLYDAAQDVLFVANIEGKSDALDGNGFISQLNLDGTLRKLNWATGLNAPKGMAVHRGKLYVTDVYRLLELNAETGQVEKTYDAVDPKNSFLNDVAVSPNGTVYVSDSRFDKIYRLKDGAWTVWLHGEQLNKPNGLLAIDNDNLLVGSTKIGALRSINVGTQAITTIADGMAATDGIINDGKKGYFVSDWNGQVFFVEKDGTKQQLLDTRPAKVSAADITYIRGKKLLLVPTFFGNTIVAYKVD